MTTLRFAGDLPLWAALLLGLVGFALPGDFIVAKVDIWPVGCHGCCQHFVAQRSSSRY